MPGSAVSFRELKRWGDAAIAESLSVRELTAIIMAEATAMRTTMDMLSIREEARMLREHIAALRPEHDRCREEHGC
jgi:hypothetical protein